MLILFYIFIIEFHTQSEQLPAVSFKMSAEHTFLITILLLAQNQTRHALHIHQPYPHQKCWLICAPSSHLLHPPPCDWMYCFGGTKLIMSAKYPIIINPHTPSVPFGDHNHLIVICCCVYVHGHHQWKKQPYYAPTDFVHPPVLISGADAAQGVAR